MDKTKLKTDAEELIEDIYDFKRLKCNDLSLMDSIIEYSYVFDMSLQEIGNILSEHEIFVNILKKQLTKEKYFKMTEEDIKLRETEMNEEEW